MDVGGDTVPWWVPLDDFLDPHAGRKIPGVEGGGLSDGCRRPPAARGGAPRGRRAAVTAEPLGEGTPQAAGAAAQPGAMARRTRVSSKAGAREACYRPCNSA